MKAIFSTVVVLALAGIAVANTPVIDGLTITSAIYGAAVSTQDTNTGFGDNSNEMNLLYVTSDANNVYVGIPGNIADNNGVTLFIDTTPGNNPPGQTIASEPGGSCPGTVPTLLRVMTGTKMDAGFDPDYALTISVGIFPGQNTAQLVYAADLTNLTTLGNLPLGIGAVGTGNGLLTGNTGASISVNNSNTGGVGGWFSGGGETPGQTGNDPTNSNTGFEIALPKSLLGLGAGSHTVSFFAFLTNNAQDGGPDGPCFRNGYASNQALPGLGGNGNLATFNPGTNIDFTGSQGPGVQFVSVVVN